MTTASDRPRLDVAGVALSALCLLHCLAVPLVATGALAWAASERVHVGLTAVLTAVVLAAALHGYRGHRRPLAPSLLALGVGLLVGAVAFGEGTGDAAETTLTVLGSVVLVAGHALNLRLSRARA